MSLKAFLESRKEGSKASEELLASMTELQERMARRLEELVAGLDTKDGAIVNSEANIRRIDEIMAILRDEFSGPEWTEAIGAYLDSLDLIAENILAYGNSIATVSDGLLDNIRRQYKALVAEYLGSATSFSASLWIPLYQQISGGVVNSSPIDQIMQGGRELLLGTGEGESGAIAGHASTTVADLTSIYERTQLMTMADDLGAKFYLYQGSEIDTTRPFCEERHGHVYHQKEIEKWASLSWAGKIPETTEATIFTMLGGYNCRHILLPLDESSVPANDLKRMRDAGLLR